MNTKNKILPYPVLGNYDAVFPLLGEDAVIMPDPIMDKDNFHFHIELNQRNQDITRLINDDKAEYLCEVYCKSTFFREKHTSSQPVFDFCIDRKSVSGHVDFELYVILKQDIIYSNIGFHDDYKGLKFELEKGNILVAFPTASYNAKLVNYKMYAVGSFMQFLDSEVADIDLDMEQNDAIYILLPHRMYSQYIESIKANQDFKDIIVSSILFNFLVLAISRYDEERDREKTWADALKGRLDEVNSSNNKKLKLKSEDAYELATLILKHPYERLFDTLVRIKESEKPQSIDI